MIQRFKKYFDPSAIKEVGYYLSSNLIKKALPFITLPFLTFYLTPDEYGTWALYLAIMTFFMPLTACGLPMITARNFHKYDHAEHAKMVFTALACIGVFSLILFIGILITSLFQDELMSIPIFWLLLLPVMVFLQNIQYFNKIILNHQSKARLFTILDVSNVAILRIGGLLAVMYISAEWLSLLMANFITHIAFAMLAIYLLLKDKRLTPVWEWARAKSMLVMGYPLIGHTIGAFILTLSDRIILERMTDLETVGIYSIGANLGAGALIFCTAFNQKWGPWLYRQVEDMNDNKRTKIVRYTYLYFIASIIMTACVVVAGYLYIHYLIDDAYAGATVFLPWIAAGSCAYGMSLAVAHYVTIEGKTKNLPMVTGTAAIINIILTITLINLNGAVGAAQATFIAYIYLFGFMWWANHRVYPMPWKQALQRSKK